MPPPNVPITSVLGSDGSGRIDVTGPPRVSGPSDRHCGAWAARIRWNDNKMPVAIKTTAAMRSAARRPMARITQGTTQETRHQSRFALEVTSPADSDRRDGRQTETAPQGAKDCP